MLTIIFVWIIAAVIFGIIGIIWHAASQPIPSLSRKQRKANEARLAELYEQFPDLKNRIK